MKNYESPIVLQYEDLAEGVYAASGAVEVVAEPECWSLSVTPGQEDAGGYSTFRVAAEHSREAQHISSKTVITIVFNRTITNAEFEGYDVMVSGTTVTLTRVSHGNSYASGDRFDTLLKVWSPDYKDGLAPVSSTIECTHEVNVQGIYD